MNTTIGIIGGGEFGQLLYTHLKKHFTVRVYDTAPERSTHILSEVASSDIVIFAVNAEHLSEACASVKEYVMDDALLMDVMSVKEYPINVLQEYFPQHQIIGTHPIFGVASVGKSLAGERIVLVNATATNDIYAIVKDTLSKTLSMKIIEQSAQEHDKQMAYILGLTHLIGKALEPLQLQSYKTNTYSYDTLLQMNKVHGAKSIELFRTIELYNPYVREVRERFLQNINITLDKL